MTAEERRLTESNERRVHWKLLGISLSERAWGTVREDYSAGGKAWEYFARACAIARVSLERRWPRRHQRSADVVCFAVALWNEQDLILKERLFTAGTEGNHGEDVKEHYSISTAPRRIRT